MDQVAGQAASSTIVPKQRRRSREVGDGFDRDAVLRRLFSLPVPPTAWGRKPYPIHTPLGRLMRVKNLMIQDVQKWDGAPNHRVMSDYLAGRKPIAVHHRAALARGLGVDQRVL